jgi:micrococcal nuclease
MRRGLVALTAALLLTACAPTAVPPSPVAPPSPPHASTPARLPVPPDAQRVRVRWISDGDTVELRAVRRGPLPQGRDVSVRLLEIDTPESKRPGVPVQCFALKATAATRHLLPRGSVAWVQTDRERHDRYGRTLGYVWNADGVFVNEVLVRRGLAKVLFYRPNDRHLDRMRAAERSARAAGRGLWAHC